MSQRDEALEKLVYQIQVLRNVEENLEQRLAYVTTAITELQLAISTLEGIGAKGSSLLVPIGGSSYIKAILDDPEKLIVSVGADVAVEKNFNDAKEDYEARISEYEGFRSSLQKQIEDLTSKLDELQRDAQSISQNPSGESSFVRGD